MIITGTADDDVLTGTVDADTISGLAGHDSITGGGGDDTIEGGDGSDVLHGDYGNDSVQGGDGDDRITDVGGGSDTLIGGAGDDHILLRHFTSWSQPVTETIRIDAGLGDDRVEYYASHFGPSSSAATIDLGAGDDRLLLETGDRDTVRVSLGVGHDVVTLSEYGYFPTTAVITDFAAGDTGDVVDFTTWFSAKTYGWDGSNPFGASGHMRLVQSSADTLLEVDGDGPSSPSGSMRALFRFENTIASAFTAANFGGWRPDGAAPPATTITGTDFYEVIEGTIGNDTISGLDERDEIDGGAGNDTIYGGAGNDSIEGGAGSDRLEGGDGDDYVSDTHGGSDTLIGGAGHDQLYFSHSDIIAHLQTLRLDTGPGNDVVDFYNSVRTIEGSLTTITLGTGNDRLILGATGAPTRIALGSGRDTVELRELTSLEDAPVFTDFAPGASGDVFAFAEHLERHGYNWDRSNPFASGHARLVRAGADTLLQLDLDGPGATYYAFTTVAAIRNVEAGRFTAANFAGFAPRVVSLAEAATVSVVAPAIIAEDGGGTLSLSLFFANVIQVRGTVTMAFTAAQSTAANGGDVAVPGFSGEYAIIPADMGGYTFALPAISILADAIAEGVETLAVTITVAGQVFDTGTDTKTVVVRVADSGHTGGTGADILTGTRFADDLTGGAGDDRLRGGLGDDRIDGGAGRDTAVFGGVFTQAGVSVTSSGATVVGPDGTDTLTGVELFRFADGTLVFDADAPGAQMQRLYAAVLNRGADQIGLEHWLDQIGDRGQSIQSIAAYFLQSPEFEASGANVAANGAFVDFLYMQVLGRAADAAGRADWVARLDGGLARSDALLFFSESQEHRALTTAVVGQGYFETDDAYQTIALLYDTFAQRKPDAAGLIGWSEALKSGGASVEAIADGFAASPEFQNGIAGKSRGQIVDYLYENTLDRPADTAGHAYWMGQLDGGVSIGRMLLYFAISDEHQALLAPWVTGGIDVAG